MLQSNKLLIFPTSRSIREYLDKDNLSNTLLPSIITIDEFFKKSLFFENKKIIDEEQRFLYLNEAVKDVNLNALGISSSFNAFLKQSDYIYRFFLEISSENVSIESIITADTYSYYEEHLEILIQIYKNYLNILEKNNAVDRINMHLHFKLNKDFISRYKNIKLYFEGYFTQFEFEIVKEISKLIELEIEFIYNEYNKKSIKKFVDYGFELEEGRKYIINLSSKTTVFEAILEEYLDSIEIKGFSSRINQIAFVKASIVNFINKGLNPSKIALVLPDEGFASLLRLFDNEGYFNYAMGIDIKTSKLYKALDAINTSLFDDEIKVFKNIEYLNIDENFYKEIFSDASKSYITKEKFNKICEYLKSLEDDNELLEKFDELCFRYEKLVFSQEEPILLKDAMKIFFQKVSSITLDDVNSGKITVMGLLESRLINFEAVIICDFNESLIPKRSLKDKFLSTALKQKVNLPTSSDREDLQKYYYKRLISNSRNLAISYVKNDSNQISRFANKLFDIKIDEKLYDNEYKHILYSQNRLKHFNEKIVLDIDLSKLVWSASSLKEFLECKRKYYLNHILKIKEHNISLKPKGYELGNIIHNTLEEYYNQDMRSYEILLDIFNKNRSENPFLNLDLEIWKKKLKDFVQLEEKRFEKGFKILALEKPFFCEYEGIKLQGKIDRIDILNDDYFVLDYKTSSNLKVSTKRTYEKAVDFQLEFYFLGVESLYKSNNINTFYYDLYNMKLLEEVVLNEKLELLKNIFSEFKTTSVNFEKCDNNQTCQYCIYKTICDKE
ncbi:hypothetical protein CRV01_12580 [Arcobacter sp. CECT 8983]|uniref:PD-(D/E)XK nuclease family protein n=1 Tax=Arcobacter sp. CECT 8983 TaxID=2044508 RepID=UPI00100B1BCB|nr:PD-(D/E)XK nuclease family protein [Arcobacter sp. CECT 8983]RXJ88573.1 hypothetical protein CRV01_12580 [Arcobacter sp. CECT 8983]